MAYNPKDFYYKKAKKENFLARSVYKLEEIDQKFKLLKPGQKVIDLGASPGSWTQYVSQKIGEHGRCVSIDLTPIKLDLKNVDCITADATAFDFAQFWMQSKTKSALGDASEALQKPEHVSAENLRFADLVLSDMAPKTTGIKSTDQMRSAGLVELALEVAQKHLKTRGHFVAKLFHSDNFKEIKLKILSQYERFEAVKPDSTRKESKEIFLIGLFRK
jgi:23S rRNA (uridine2552-2'-O)-methyltransferase